MKVGTGIALRTRRRRLRQRPQSRRSRLRLLRHQRNKHNPFITAALAAEHTTRAQVRTSIALAFARSPMDTAYQAWDLQSLAPAAFNGNGQPSPAATSSAALICPGDGQQPECANTSPPYAASGKAGKPAPASTSPATSTTSTLCPPSSPPTP